MKIEDFTGATWRKSSRSGPYSDNCVEVAFIGAGEGGAEGGGVAVRDSKNPTGAVLLFSPDEWSAFVGGTKDGDFDL